MEVIKANPESVSEIFDKIYVIPEYQRPYSWDEEKCEDLWNDVKGQYEEDKENEYFLGTMVLIKKDNVFEVIDGQQRLTSLMLLLRALYDHHQFKGIERKMYIFDSLSDDVDKNKIKIESKVIEQNKEDLYKIISEDGASLDSKNIFKLNYECLKEKIREWKKNNDLEDFTRFLLNNVKILPIDCGTEENALKIFQTLNNRGTPLNDSDIFKSHIYNSLNTQEKKDEFINFWNNDINSSYDWYFRVYMHILRAKEGIQENEINLRKFFKERIKKDNVENIIEDMKKILLIDSYSNKKIDKYLSLMWAYPVDIIVHVYYVFMYKYSYLNDDGVLELVDKDLNNLSSILKDLIKYVYIKGIIYRTANSIKHDIYKAYVNIMQKKIKNVFPSIEKEKDKFINSLSTLTNRDKYTKSILFLYHNLNEKQDYIEFDYNKLQIEHILPKAPQHYDNWSSKEYDLYLNTLGNLTLIENKKNIKAKNEFFDKKKEIYKKSEIIDVQKELCKLKKWTPKECEERFNNINERLLNFLFN